jgi:predicted regulator of Ras-like GTPase activity (Roadblock/LC7/MglB family)
MTDLLYALNKTPGVLGSAWLEGDRVEFDMGEAIGGPEAAPVAHRAAEACRAWMQGGGPLETAVFTAERGRLLLRVVGDGMLVVFTEADAATGLVKVRMRETAEQIQSLAAAHG